LKPNDQFGWLKGAQGIYSMLEAIGAVQLWGLASGIPMRGGIDAGTGVRLYKGEIYGPALLNAYHIESQRAEYPRVVAGDGLLKFLDEAAALADSFPPTAGVTKMYVTFCREILCEAPDDGQTMLDFLAPKWKNAGRLAGAGEQAHEFAKRELERHRDRRDHKLEARYRRLLHYFGLRGFGDAMGASA
jgi:hypothetical protein